MQKNAMALKNKAFWDGVEIPGLVSVGERVLEKSTIEVPSFHRLRTIQSGITKLPILEMVYRIDRNSVTKKYFNDFYLNDEDHDLVLVDTDASGTEWDRELYPGCECIYRAKPAYDAASPSFAKLTIKIVPWDYIIINT